MPLEIKELVIRATVSDQPPLSGQNTSTAVSSGYSSNVSTGQEEAIIEACVEKVLQILKDKEER